MREKTGEAGVMGPIIRTRRTELRLTQQEVAVKAAMGLAQYGRIELGKGGRPLAKTLRAISLALQMPDDWLFDSDLSEVAIPDSLSIDDRLARMPKARQDEARRLVKAILDTIEGEVS